MSDQPGPSVSLGEIISQEQPEGFLKTLSALAGIPIVLVDRAGRPLAAYCGNGIECRAVPEAGQAGPRTPCPCQGLGDGREEWGLSQEIRLREWRLGEVRSCLKGRPDPLRARQSIELAVRWIQDRIHAEYNMDSLSGEVLNKYEELNLLYELSEEMASVFDTEEVCRIVLRKALNVIGAEKASILLWDPVTEHLRVAASVGLDLPGEGKPDPLLETGISGYVFRTGRPLLVEDLEDLPEELAPGKGLYRTDSFLSVPLLSSPLKVKEKVVGVINLADKPSRKPYHAGDLKLLSAISSEAALSIYSSLLVRDLKENERIQKEMEIAETVQRNLLPVEAPRIPGMDVAGRCVPARRVGGDYFDFFSERRGRLGVVVADVSGHSIGSGIMMAITRGLLKSEAIQTRPPGRLLKAVNRILFNDLVSSELFITMAYLLFSPGDRSLCFVNGGHNPPILLRAGHEEPELLDAEGMAIGLLPDVEFEEKRWNLGPGDVLVVYTDGLVEADDPHGRPFGMGRLVDCLRRTRDRPARDILEELLQAVWDHMGGQDPRGMQQDDITLVVMKAVEPGK